MVRILSTHKDAASNLGRFKDGKTSFRRAGPMHHLGTGTPHRNKRVLAIADDTTVTVIELDTGEILSTHTIEPGKNYWRNQQQSPGRWPGLHET
jgi:hypothetical protein